MRRPGQRPGRVPGLSRSVAGLPCSVGPGGAQRQQLADQQAATRLQAKAIADQTRVQEREQANLVAVQARTLDRAKVRMLAGHGRAGFT